VLLSDKKIKELKNIWVDWIRISIYGADEKENDQFLRHTKSFEKIINALEKLKENGFKRKVRITIMKPNVNNIESLTQKLYDMGVEEIDYRPYNPTLNPKANEEFDLSKEEFNRVIPVILKLRKRMENITQLKFLPWCYEFLYGKELPPESAVAKCQCGRSYLWVNATWDIRVCFGLHDNIGNIRKNDLLEVWQENKLLKEIRKCEVGDDCDECIFKKYCKTSDCFAIKLNTFGHLNKKNTVCPLPYPLTSTIQWKQWQKVNNII
jgi:radical SAM protein with 4Fe4S-binding SPASM domain